MTWSPPLRPYQCAEDPECSRGTAVEGDRCWHHGVELPLNGTPAGHALRALNTPGNVRASAGLDIAPLLTACLDRVNHADTPPT